MSNSDEFNSGLDELGTPEAEREARPALYPDDAELDDHVHSPVHDARRQSAPRRHGPWASVAYWAQWVGLQVYGPASQTSAQDPIEELKRRYGRHERQF